MPRDQKELVPGWFKSALRFCAGVIGLAAAITAVVTQGPEFTRDQRLMMLALTAASLVLAAASALVFYLGSVSLVRAFDALRRRVARVEASVLMGAVRGLLFVVFGGSALCVNTLLLNEFFRPLLPVATEVAGMTIHLSIVMAATYSAYLFMGGIGSAHTTTYPRTAKPRQMTMYRVILTLNVALGIAIEMLLLGLLSLQINWPWPDDAPSWLNAWLGIMGLLMGGGLSITGYLIQKAWDNVLSKAPSDPANPQPVAQAGS